MAADPRGGRATPTDEPLPIEPRPVRVLIVSSHPVQYAIPVYRRYMADPRVELTVAFCTGVDTGRQYDEGFGREVTWGIPMFDGYRYIAMKNRSRNPTTERDLGMINPEVWSLIRSGNYDVVISPGYRGITFWMAFFAARTMRIPFAWATDADRISGPHTRGWVRRVKDIVVPFIYGRADMVFTQSTRGQRFFTSLHLRRPTVHMIPYAIGNEFFAEHVAAADRTAIRRSWDIEPDAFVVATCAKFIPKKRTIDVIEAVAKVPDVELVIAGDGELRSQLEARVAALGIGDRTHFIGFADQAKIAEVYAACDVLVVASDFEPFGMVVGEAMAGGRTAIVSDQVGCIDDLVFEGETGWVYPVGDVDALADRITKATEPGLTKTIGERAQARMQTWTPKEHVDAVVEACQGALARHS